MEETNERIFIMSSLGLDICSTCKLRFNCMVAIQIRTAVSPLWYRVLVFSAIGSLVLRNKRIHIHTPPEDGYISGIPCLKKNEGSNIDTYRVLSILGCHGDGYVKVSEWKYQQP